MPTVITCLKMKQNQTKAKTKQQPQKPSWSDCLLWNQEDLSSNPQGLLWKPGMTVCLLPPCWRTETSRLLTSRLRQNSDFRFDRRSCLKKSKGGSKRGRHPASDGHMGTSSCPHTCRCISTNTTHKGWGCHWVEQVSAIYKALAFVHFPRPHTYTH